LGALRRLLWPGFPLGLLLLPTALAWLDVARGLLPDRHAYRQAERRVVVLGFDGVDPDILREMMDRLPAMRRLAEEGTFLPCRTTEPPESPVAWATFATGRLPGGHGVFDFVRRDWRMPGEGSYQPRNGLVDRIPPLFGPAGVPLRPPQAVNLRDGEGFWEPVARAGYRVSILRMPLTLPATLSRGGELLTGLGTPDLRGTNGSYTLFAAGRDAADARTEFGGRHVKIYIREGVAEAALEGPPDPRRLASLMTPAGTPAPEVEVPRLTVPVRFTFAPGSAAVSLDGGPAVSLLPGLYGPWMDVSFRAGPLVRLQGLIRFLLLRTGDSAAIYASPIQIAPTAPVVPISAPPSFAGDLARRLGPFRTAGWPEDTFARNDNVTNDAQMFVDIRDSYRTNERLFLDRLDRSHASLLSIVFTATDRMQHMFFRYRDPKHPAHDPAQIEAFRRETGVSDPIFESYRWMDATVQAVLDRLGPDDVLLIASDHGFHSWRIGVNLNTWLLDHGYLVLRDPSAGRSQRNLDRFFRGQVPVREIDWTKTKAYALGLGQIYLNLKGREALGVVEPADHERVLADIIAGLSALVGPDGQPVFETIERGTRIWHGPHLPDAPDLQCAFASGYRVSWQTALIGVPPDVFETNTRAWSGDHCSNWAGDTPGVFLSNRRLAAGVRPGIEDIAPTVCELFGAPPPAGGDGAVLPLIPELAPERGH